MATTRMRAKFPLALLLLGTLFLASSVSLTYGQQQQMSPCRRKCLQGCTKENDPTRRHACQASCELSDEAGGRCRGQSEQQGEEDERQPGDSGKRPRGRGEQQEPQDEEKEGEWHGGRRKQDPEERERVRREKEREQKKKEKEQQEREESESESESKSRRSRNNPFYFPRRRFHTRYGNQHGKIRLLQRFDRRSSKLENLQNYRLMLIDARPHTLILPKHADAESILIVQEGDATVHIVNANNRESYNMERGHAIRIPAGTIDYIVNRNDNQDLRIAKLIIPVNQPGKFDDFFPASNEDQESYFRGFSRNILEAAFNAPMEEIERTLLEENEEEGRQQRESEEEGVVMKLSREQVQELTRHAKSSGKGRFSESGPFNLRGRNPIYSNNFGKMFEVTPDWNPQLQDLDVSLSCVEIRKGGIMLPHINSRATVVIEVRQGGGTIEMVAPREHQQQEEEEEEEEEEKQMRRYWARLFEGDAVVIPAGYPVAVNASSELHLLGIAINAQNNQRSFLAGEKDNVLKQIHREVKELAFPGSGEQVERLFEKQRESYFASAQPQQKQQEREREGPLLSILGAFN